LPFALRVVNAEKAIDRILYVLLREIGSAQEVEVVRCNVHFWVSIKIVLDEEGEVPEVDEPGVKEADEVFSHRELH